MAQGRAGGAASDVGRWESARIPFPTYAINTVMLPTGKVLFWGRSPIDPGTGERKNDTPAYVWDPAKASAGFTAVRPPKMQPPRNVPSRLRRPFMPPPPKPAHSPAA